MRLRRAGALGLVLPGVLLATPALAGGGTGGSGFGWSPVAGAGGYDGTDGGVSYGGAGGGGGGAGGGNGGSGGDWPVTHPGGAGGTAGDVDGKDGSFAFESSATPNGGGGGGGGYNGNGSGSSTLQNTGTTKGGNGGAGGSVNISSPYAGGGAGGGGGGAGGYGAVVLGNGASSNTGSIIGGIGGNGGNSGRYASDQGGGGGDGGVGVQFTTSGATFTNSGTITGGTGGLGGAGASPANNGSGGSGGAGIVGSGLTVINSGNIAGGWSGDHLTQANAVTFAGGSNVYEMQVGATLSGNVVDQTGNGTFRLGGSIDGSFDLTELATSQYQGFTHLAKSGSSTWTLTNSSGWTSDVTIGGGTLFVQDSLANASLVTVNATGTLAGTGPASAVQVNAGGTFAPGNGTPGSTMTVASLAFQSGAQYLVSLNPSTSSFANVTGTATLGGATVKAAFASVGGYVQKQYTILNAGSISGTFDPTVANVDLPSGFKSSLSYDATHAFLNLELSLPSAQNGNANQRNVANAVVNFFNTTGSIPAAFGNLTPNGLTQVSGELGTGSQQATFQAMTMFMGLLTDPFSAGRGGDAASGATGFAEEESLAYAGRTRASDPRDALATFAKASPRAAFDQRWNVWASGFGGSQTTDGNAVVGSNNTTGSIYGVAVGADYWFSPNTVAGFALAGGGSNFSVVNGGSGRSDIFQAGAFVRHNFGATYLTAAAAYGWQDVTTDRYVSVAGVDHLRANFNANAYSGRLELGHRFLTPWFGGLGVSPYAAVQGTAFELPSYAERAISGASTFALNYGANTATSSRTELGLRSDKSVALDGAVLTLRGRAAWAHDFNPDRAVTPTFQALPGASFVTNGAALASNSALATASAELRWLNGWSAAATFEGEFSNVTRSYAGKGVVRYNW